LVGLAVVVIVFAAAIIYLRVISPPCARGRVAPADDRSYFGIAHSLISKAETSVDVILYQSRFYFHYPLSASNTLLADLAEAGDRGVRVRAVIEQADWNPENSEENRDVWNVLRQSKIDLYFDPVGTTSHSKLVIIDGRQVILGSTNWSHYSLDENNEASIVIESNRVAGSFRKYFGRLVDRSSRDFTPSSGPIAAAEIEGWQDRSALIVDVADSGGFDVHGKQGRIHFGSLIVRAEERPLEEILAVDSLFFSKVAGETVRVLARVDRNRKDEVGALDLEMKNTPKAMVAAFAKERSGLKTKRFPEPEIEWMEAPRIVPVPNEKYAPEVTKLIGKANRRIWAAMLDARYYDTTPRTAKREKRPGDVPSVSNSLLNDLVVAAGRGVDVRFVCDMGWYGRPPESKVEFLDRLKAGGVEVYEDPADVTTHAKILIVDDDFVVIGSTNWSYHALEENNETAVIIESGSLNQHYADYISAIIAQATPH
jgi:hypothetical protein